MDAELTALDILRSRQHQQLVLWFDEDKRPQAVIKGKKEQRQREIDQIFNEYLHWIEETMTTEDNPYIQVVAVLQGFEE